MLINVRLLILLVITEYRFIHASQDNFLRKRQAIIDTVIKQGKYPNTVPSSRKTGETYSDDRSHHPTRGAFEGGPTGTTNDTKLNNVINFEDQILYREFDIPTGGRPSPLAKFSVSDWVTTFLHLEEFGSIDIPTDAEDEDGGEEEIFLPTPDTVNAFPDPRALDQFLDSTIYPLPTEYANNATSPWKGLVESYLGRSLSAMPVEGRPTGTNWKHQRWDEFPPKKYFQSATTGARTNLGLRHHLQSHEYSDQTEFGANGLYADQRLFGVEVKFHPNLPIQNPETLWGFDGTFPPKLAMARYGEPLLFRHYNALPVNVTANAGFGVHTLTTHKHNGHNPSESDGYTNAFFFPGQFYDYRWPMVLAGHDSINVDARDIRAGRPDGNSGITRIPGDWHETMSTLWFHDHMLDFTAANVYKGIVAMINYYSALDRGNEKIDDGVNLRLPSGTHLDFGNRDYDINVIISDKAWDEEGQLWFNPHNKMGFIGDRLLTNFCYKPTLEVRARRYRFRLLNGSVSRFLKIALVAQAENGDWNRVPVYMVANDGNIMEHAVKFENGVLPTVGIAERYDIVVDFSVYEGRTLYFVNTMQHKNGVGTDAIIPLEEIMVGLYEENLYKSEDEYRVDPCVGKFMRIHVNAYSGEDLSMDPEDYVEGGNKMIPLSRPTNDELATATHRSFELERSPDGPSPWGVGTDGGESLAMDPHRVSAAVEKGPNHLEVWRLLNSGSWSHPYHIHFEEAIILSKNGEEPPPHEKFARKDVFRMGPDEDSATVMELAYHFRDFNASFMGHCHNTQHEDHAMLLRYDVQNANKLQYIPAPIPFWDGVRFEQSFAVDTVRTGDGIGPRGPQLEPVKEWLQNVKYGGFGTNGTQDLATVHFGDALTPTLEERGWVDIPLRKGIMKDHEDREVWFVLHDVSVKSMSEKLGVAYAGALQRIPEAALGEAAVYDASTDTWEFYGDLPNGVGFIEQQSNSNNYSPFRRVLIDGQDIVINAFFVKWGEEPYEQLRVDHTCTFPDHPPNTKCMYNGHTWGVDTGHILDININRNGQSGIVKFKLHKSWAEDGDYIPYYIVVDSHPQGTANAMGITWVPKHQFLGITAAPLVQFLPGQKLRDSYPPTPEDGFGISFGGGPLGGQIGLPSYFQPGDNYSPAWHIGFAHWNHNTTEVVKSFDRIKSLRRSGDLTIHEFPPPAISDNFDFAHPNPPHVVNCPTSITVDFVPLIARRFEDMEKQLVRDDQDAQKIVDDTRNDIINEDETFNLIGLRNFGSFYN